MTPFSYKDGLLYAEDVALPEIAEAAGTPSYVYSNAAVCDQYSEFSRAFDDIGLNAQIFFAVKVNGNLAIIRTLADLGAGADVVSLGELLMARKAGIPAQKIVFAGVGKSAEEIRVALDEDILQFNVESIPELHLISELASAQNKRARIALRVNPNIDAGTHRHISTGLNENKFGLPIEEAVDFYALADRLPCIDPVAVAVHIGSQITDLAPFRAAFTRLAELVGTLREKGHDLQRVDIGGGLGLPLDTSLSDSADNIPSPPSPAAYARMVKEALGHLNVPIMLEPGRRILGNAGVLLTRVIYEKQTPYRRFVVLDAAMNDLIRPALYGAHHPFVPVARPPAETPKSMADLVGPICESTDCFARDQLLPIFKPGDLGAFTSAGGYSAVMASSYNLRPRLAEVLVRGDKFDVVRPRQTYDDLLGGSCLSSWQVN